MLKKLNVDLLDNNQIQERFDSTFRALGEDINNDLRVNEIDVDIVRDANRAVRVHVTIYGLAEVTKMDQFYNPATKQVVKGGEKVSFDVAGRGQAEFVFENVERKNSNDYVVIYKPL